MTDPLDKKMDRNTDAKSNTRAMAADLIASIAVAVGIGVGASLALGAAVLILAQPSATAETRSINSTVDNETHTSIGQPANQP